MHKPDVINLSFLLALTLFLFVVCSKDKVTNSPSNYFWDIDGNRYKTVTIGNQVWMAENLKVTHYRDGRRIIPNVPDVAAWRGLTSGAYCNYDNDTAFVAVYGRLYNWYAVADSHNIAPVGWHVPSNAEWGLLIGCFGGDGGKMKEEGFTHWISPNIGATNDSGFTVLPGGFRYEDGGYTDMTRFAAFWSTTKCYSYSAWGYGLFYNTSAVVNYDIALGRGISIRCVKD
jgi:uncharacterized protein (TIGR02145 family)